jgi:hypothetical protein
MLSTNCMVSLSESLVNTRETAMSKSGAWSFWRDEAKLSLLDPEARVKVLFGVLAGLVIAGISGLIGAKIGLDTLQSSLLSIFVGLILFPATLAVDMFYKGRRAGNKLKDERDAAVSLQESTADRRSIARALETARQALQYLVMCDIPGQKKVSTQLDLQSARHAFVQEVKRKTNHIITVCDRDTAGMPGISLGTDGLDGIDESSRLSDYITSKIETIEALARTI